MIELPFLMIEPGYYFGEIDFAFIKYKNLTMANSDPNLFLGDAEVDLDIHQGDGPLRRAFNVKALGPKACDMLTLSKQDLHKVEGEFEEMVNEIFLHSYKKIRKILKIKEKAEIAIAEKNARINVMGRGDNDDDNFYEEYKVDHNEVRRIATSLYSRSESGAP